MNPVSVVTPLSDFGNLLNLGWGLYSTHWFVRGPSCNCEVVVNYVEINPKRKADQLAVYKCSGAAKLGKQKKNPNRLVARSGHKFRVTGFQFLQVLSPC